MSFVVRSKGTFLLGPLYTSPGWHLTRVELPRRITLLQSNVCKCLHEKNSQARSTCLAGEPLLRSGSIWLEGLKIAM